MDESNVSANKKTLTQFIKDFRIISICSEHMEFFGCLLYQIPINIFEHSPNHPGLAYTDGKSIFISTHDEICKNFGRVSFVCIHELLHIICEHVEGAVDKDPTIWNLATDHVINRMCIELQKHEAFRKNDLIDIPTGIVFFDNIHATEPAIGAERLYEMLMKNYDKKNKTLKVGNKEYKIIEIPGGSLGEGPVSYENASTYKITDKSGKSFYSTDFTNGNIDKSNGDATETVKNLQESAKCAWVSGSVNKGNLPGSFISEFNKRFSIKIPWTTILEEAIIYPVQNLPRRSWSWPNYYIKDPWLPGNLYNNMSNHTMLIAIDSSGSVSDADLNKFLSVVCECGEYYNKIIILVHDVIVNNKIYIDLSDESNKNKDTIFEQIKNVSGRGGTSHKYVFEEIDNLIEEENVSSIIFQTDYFSDVHHYYKNHSWMSEFKTIWVLNSNENLNLDCDTIVLRLAEGELYES